MKSWSGQFAASFFSQVSYWLVVSNIFYFHPYLGKVSILTNIFEMGWNHQPGIVTYLKNFGVMFFHVPKIQGLLGPHFSLALGAGWSCALVFQSHMWFRKETPAKHALNLKVGELVFLFKADSFFRCKALWNLIWRPIDYCVVVKGLPVYKCCRCVDKNVYNIYIYPLHLDFPVCLLGHDRMMTYQHGPNTICNCWIYMFICE